MGGRAVVRLCETEWCYHTVRLQAFVLNIFTY